MVTLDLRLRTLERGRVLLFASEPISISWSLHFRPQLSVMPQLAEIDLNDLEPSLRENASIKQVFLVVVASLPARGSGDGVRRG